MNRGQLICQLEVLRPHFFPATVLDRPALRRQRAISPASRRGGMLIIIAACLVLFVIAAAFSVDVAYMQLTRTEMRTAVDAAARTAGHVISNGGSDTQARTAAQNVSASNNVAGAPMTLASSNIVFGKSTRQSNGTYNFVAGQMPSNAVRVTADRTQGSTAGAVNLFFGKLLGVQDFEPTEVATVIRGDRDVMLVIDASGSMMSKLDSQDYPTGCDASTPPHPTLSRWALVRQSLDLFLNVLANTAPEEQVGLVTYGTNATFHQTLTNDYNLISAPIDAIGSAPISGWTNLGEGLLFGQTYLTTVPESRFYAARTIVLLTDGQPNVGPDPIDEATACKDKNIVVHTISFSDFADQAMMQEIADITGGDYYHAPDSATLLSAFEEIGLNLPVFLTE